MRKHLITGLSISLMFTIVFGHQISNSHQQIEQNNPIVETINYNVPTAIENNNYKLDLSKETSDEEQSEENKKMDKKTLFTILLVIPVIGILIGLTLQLIKLKKSKK